MAFAIKPKSSTLDCRLQCSRAAASQMMHSTGHGQKMIMATRVFGWAFLDCSYLSWAEYQRPHPKCDKSYYWQLHNANENTSLTWAEKLSIVFWRTHERLGKQVKHCVSHAFDVLINPNMNVGKRPSMESKNATRVLATFLHTCLQFSWEKEKQNRFLHRCASCT